MHWGRVGRDKKENVFAYRISVLLVVYVTCRLNEVASDLSCSQLNREMAQAWGVRFWLVRRRHYSCQGSVGAMTSLPPPPSLSLLCRRIIPPAVTVVDWFFLKLNKNNHLSCCQVTKRLVEAPKRKDMRILQGQIKGRGAKMGPEALTDTFLSNV